MEYITVKEAAERWGITPRRVQFLCVHEMIPGVTRHGKSWAIPSEARKPNDSRYKLPEKKKADPGENIISLIGTTGRKDKDIFNFFEYFPYPIQVYFPDGIMAFINEACLSILHIPSKEDVVGKFNVLNDPVIDAWGAGVRAEIAKSFQGEIVRLDNIKIPIPNIIDRFESGELCYDSSFQNITCFPVYNDKNQLTYVVHLFITLRLFNGREEIVRAKEYIENCWIEDFDLEKVAKAVNLSKYHFAHLFKKYTSTTPYSYYQDVKVKRLKAALCNDNLSIKEAFSICGVDYHGNYAGIFRRKTGMTPSQYRRSIMASSYGDDLNS